jgi:DUF4097 and DUF4098 domain-containing protein YvlB
VSSVQLGNFIDTEVAFMSWLYTIVFSGLVFASSGADAALNQIEQWQASVPEAVVEASDPTEKFEQTYPLAANGKVRVSNINGSITITAWDRSEVKVEYTKTADTAERLKEVEVKINSSSDAISVETDHGNRRTSSADRWSTSGRSQVDIRLTVPRGASLNEIETVNGSISLSGINNFAKVSAVNGTVTASNVSGRIRLSTVNGEVNAELDRLETRSSVTLETVNGRVLLTLPSDSNATIKADSVNGTISNDFGLPVRRGKYVGRDLHGRVGTGEVQVRLSSVNGTLSVNRRKDGKTPGPVVNLLPAAGSDDVSTGPSPAEVDRLVRETRRTVAKASAQIDKEITAVRPELEKAMAESGKVSVEAMRIAAETLRSDVLKDAIRNGIATGADGRLAGIYFTSGSTPSVEKKANSFAVSGVPNVDLTANDCSVSVRGWDRNEVQYRVVKLTGVSDEKTVSVIEAVNGPDIGIRVENAGNDNVRGRNPDMPRTARIEIFVPKRTNIKIKAEGAIRIDGVSGEMTLIGRDESVNVRDSEGKLSIRSYDGRIRVVGHRGEVNVQSSDGAIALDGDFSLLTVNSSDGDVEVAVPTDLSAVIRSTREAITVDGIKILSEDRSETGSRLVAGGGANQFSINTEGSVRIRSRESMRVTY